LIEPIKLELHLSDTAIGFLTGTALASSTPAWAFLGTRRGSCGPQKAHRAVGSIWSLMTALSGMAANFTQLLLSRIGVGIGEAGGTPPRSRS